MISRIIISLKRATSSRQTCLDVEVPGGLPMNFRDGHSPCTVDGIPLRVLVHEESNVFPDPEG